MEKKGRRFCSNKCRARFIATHPERFAQTKTRRGRGGKRDDLGGRYFRSSWEANWARYLNTRIVAGEIRRWEYESETFEFPIRRGSRFYTPDFRVVYADGSMEYQEIKGYMDQKSRTKLKRMAKYHPSVSVVVIDAARYHRIEREVAAKVPHWEARR